ncbi:MAG: hypothetical protein VX304_10670 [Planctomycetota bacterium]|nr:hypothetical protein [Planctomycetota bacterium]
MNKVFVINAHMVEDVSLKILEDARPTRKGKTNHAIHPLIRTDSLSHSCQRYQNYTLHLQTLRRDLNPANSLCEAMGGGKERVGDQLLPSRPGQVQPGMDSKRLIRSEVNLFCFRL